MSIETLLNVYIDANILLLVAYTLWSLARFLLTLMGLKHAYVTQLRLLNSGMVAIALSPFFVWLLGGLTTQYSMNISDIVVAQYLAGNVEISPTRLQMILGLRDDFLRDFAEQSSVLAQGTLVFLTAGFAWFSLRITNNILKLRRIISSSFAWRRFGRLHILVSDRALVPFSTRDLRNRYIVIPESMLGNMADVRMAVAHELEHFRRLDVEWEILLEFLRPLFFWNPVFYGWKRQVSELREFSCDQMLIRRKTFDVRAYCDCLLRASRHCVTAKKAVVAVPTVAMVSWEKNRRGGVPSVLRSRIIALTGTQPTKTPQARFLLLIAPLMLMVVLSAMMIQRPTDWSYDRLMLSTIINLERLDARSTLATRP